MKQTSMQYLRARYDGAPRSFPRALFVLGWALTLVVFPIVLLTPAFWRNIRGETARRRAFLASRKQEKS